MKNVYIVKAAAGQVSIMEILPDERDAGSKVSSYALAHAMTKGVGLEFHTNYIICDDGTVYFSFAPDDVPAMAAMG